MMSGKNGHHGKDFDSQETDMGEAQELAAENSAQNEQFESTEFENISDEMLSEGSGFSDPLQALAAENDQLDAEIADLKDKLLRSAAEMENLRRRTQKDVADARAYSIAGFARDILGVADNLRRAIEHVDEADKEQSGLKTLIEGVEMTERELLAVMERNGVRKISPMNEKFDPNFHQAMFEVPNSEVPNNTVLEIVQDGFVIGERVLRPAMVGVSKGGPKSPNADSANADEEAVDQESNSD